MRKNADGNNTLLRPVERLCESACEGTGAHHIDSHRPAVHEGDVHHVLVEKPVREASSLKVRGTPTHLYRIRDAHFDDEPRPQTTYETSHAPITQVCIDGVSRAWWSSENVAFKNVLIEDSVSFGKERPATIEDGRGPYPVAAEDVSDFVYRAGRVSAPR